MLKIISLSIVLSLFACQGNAKPETSNNNETPVVQPTEPNDTRLEEVALKETSVSLEEKSIDKPKSTPPPEQEKEVLNVPIADDSPLDNTDQVTEKSEVKEVQPTSSVEPTEDSKPDIKPKTASPTERPKDSPPAPIEEEAPVPPLHAAFNTILKNHVSQNGKVNYNKLKTNEKELDAYIETIQNNPPAKGWSKNKKLAYWINAYNAFTLKKIVVNYPVKSITELNGGKPWDDKWINIGGKTYSLNNIENDIIRPRFKDARIHFAVNCAAKSCPPLLNKAYTEANLNALLNSQTKKFINNAGFNAITKKSAAISKIFEWYAVDFGDIASFINKYSNTKVDAGVKVTYQDYNWALNN